MTDSVLSEPLLEENFLFSLSESRVAVAVFLMGGVKLQGNLTGFDAFAVIIQRSGHSQLVYKHAIASIMPLDGGAA